MSDCTNTIGLHYTVYKYTIDVYTILAIVLHSSLRHCNKLNCLYTHTTFAALNVAKYTNFNLVATTDVQVIVKLWPVLTYGHYYYS